MKQQTVHIATALALLASSAVHAQTAVQWKVADGGNGHWYQLQLSQLGRDEASATARTHGAELASITDGYENEFVRGVAAGQSAWIGGNQAAGACEPGCGWMWLDAEPWSYTRWDLGTSEPNDGGGGEPGEQGLELRASGYWNDYGTWRPLPAALIEWSADCNNDGIVDYGQILQGQLADTNTDGIPDTCQCGTIPSLPTCCPGDLDHDAAVGGADIGLLLSNWGPCGNACLYDLNNDDKVNGGDLGLLLAGWGPCPN